MKQLWKCLGAVALCLCLTGCSLGSALRLDNDSLLFAPQQSAEEKNVLDTLRMYLGKSVLLKYPAEASGVSSPLFSADMDGDGAQEMVVTYQNTAKSKNVQLALFCPAADGDWRARHMDIEGAGGEVEFVRLVGQTGSTPVLAVAYLQPDETGLLRLYCVKDGTLQSFFEEKYQRCLLSDIDGDGGEELLFVCENPDYGILQLEVYGLSEEEGEPSAAQRGVTTLDARFTRCMALCLNRLSDTVLTLAMDFEDETGQNRLGEVLTYAGGEFIRCFTPESASVPNYTSRSFTGLGLYDTDGDGLTEMPRVDGRVLTGDSQTQFYFVSWYVIGPSSQRFVNFSMADIKAGYLLVLPSEWRTQVVLQQDEAREWSIRGLTSGRRLVTLTLVGVGEKAPGGEAVLLGAVGQQRLYMLPDSSLSAQEMETITNGMLLLYT